MELLAQHARSNPGDLDVPDALGVFVSAKNVSACSQVETRAGSVQIEYEKKAVFERSIADRVDVARGNNKL